ncbi:hypothetical protein L6452_37144 [Arctium lappa]|uniref:Uncharacterized protein n=1 Tax=Arctium lappa TaxID=4217 RepID=A0ACB8Y2W6_ARCLA|nr:hypothetical protein L6452_37144 [Arctium lappa]
MTEASNNGSNDVKNTTNKTLSFVAVSQPPKPVVFKESLGVISHNSLLSVLEPETFSISKKINDSTATSQTSKKLVKVKYENETGFDIVLLILIYCWTDLGILMISSLVDLKMRKLVNYQIGS